MRFFSLQTHFFGAFLSDSSGINNCLHENWAGLPETSLEKAPKSAAGVGMFVHSHEKSHLFAYAHCLREKRKRLHYCVS